MTNDAQLKANQENSKLGGVKTSEGKAISKFNAVTHGILRNSITEYEQEFYSNILDDLQDEYQPQGVVEQMLIERISICNLKLFRVQKAETEFIKSKLKPAFTKLEVPDWGTTNKDGYKPKITDAHVEKLSNVYSRYETTIENRLFRAIHELERAQKVRKGENVSQTLTVDVNQVGSFGETDKKL
ncbi:MAG: hypothetical protein HYW62_00905 [Candidatus Levybacteria bacterium]|nr:hypothetical protein [Candidatus Levybacteria bacterium]